MWRRSSFARWPCVMMFPIIPQHLVKVTPDGDSEVSVTPKVVSGMYIPGGTCSGTITGDIFCQKDVKSSRVYQVHMAGDKLMGAERWAPSCRLAGDCHSCNLLLQQEGSNLVLQVLRPIQPAEELLMWFSQQLLALLGIPCLAPANIQGDKLYVCLHCGRHFETPNPLKLHLALDCDRFGRDHLWKKLLQRNSLPQTSNLIGLNFELMVPSREIKPSFEPCDLSVTISHKNDSAEVSKNLQHQRNAKCKDNLTVTQAKRTDSSKDGGSAFKPYRGQRSCSSNIISDGRTLFPLLMPTSPQLVFHRATSSAALRQELMEKSKNKIDPGSASDRQCAAVDVAQLEMNLSNFSRGKQGHLCIYCGKIYSRKYGLKIHIRTHTGYKPLKCKYCLRPFGDPSNLNKHVRLHAEGDTPYKCELCGKILVRRRDLERHIRSRHSPHLVQEVTSSSVLSLQNTS